MNLQTINRRDTEYFSDLANELIDDQEKLSQFLAEPFTKSNFETQIQSKENSFTNEQRKTLFDVLNQQLAPYFNFSKVKENVEALKNSNTFTVTAGHQLNLYGGPLYVAYKIMHTIRLAEELNAAYPKNHIVPVFWMATEDHDFEEINHLHLFHDTLTWDSDQKGPVGRFSLDGFDGFKSNLLAKFGNNQEMEAYLDQFYHEDNLAAATRSLMMDLFGDYGLVILDADNSTLKKSFATVIEKEITEQFSVKEVEASTQQLEEKGYFGQAMARPINLFYIKDQLRERIIPHDDGTFEIGDLSFTKKELLKDLEEHPERFSPNVILRPLFQEFILPNLCYLGGGGEMAYWLQLKGVFEQANVPFPLIQVRNSIQWFDKSALKKLNKLELQVKDVFLSIHENKKQFVMNKTDDELDFSLLEKYGKQFIDEMEQSITAVDKALEGYAKSESTKVQKQIDTIQQKLIRHQKKQHDDAMKQMENVYARLFPNNGLQERFENMIPYLAKYGKKEFVQHLHDAIQPFEKELILLIEEE